MFKIGDKTLAVSALEPNSRYSIKLDDTHFLELTDLPGSFPAPYLARAKWVQVDSACCDMPDRDIDDLPRRSYDLAFAILTRKFSASCYRSRL